MPYTLCPLFSYLHVLAPHYYLYYGVYSLLSYHWSVRPVGCRTFRVSDQWDVGLIRCRTNGMSVYRGDPNVAMQMHQIIFLKYLQHRKDTFKMFVIRI